MTIRQKEEDEKKISAKLIKCKRNNCKHRFVFSESSFQKKTKTSQRTLRQNRNNISQNPTFQITEKHYAIHK